jgi:hypothetical protein
MHKVHDISYPLGISEKVVKELFERFTKLLSFQYYRKGGVKRAFFLTYVRFIIYLFANLGGI